MRTRKQLRLTRKLWKGRPMLYVSCPHCGEPLDYQVGARYWDHVEHGGSLEVEVLLPQGLVLDEDETAQPSEATP